MPALVQTVYFGRQFLNAEDQSRRMTEKAMVEVEELVREIAQALVDEPDGR